LEQILKALGRSWVSRKMAKASSVIQRITQNTTELKIETRIKSDLQKLTDKGKTGVQKGFLKLFFMFLKNQDLVKF
jgi:flagellar hook assembly protein FlgD